MKFIAAVAASLLANSKLCSAANGPKQPPAETPVQGMFTSQGCFSSVGNMTKMDIREFVVSSGTCGDACQEDKEYAVMATSGQSCYCGTMYPPKDDLVDDDKCNFACPGYPMEACGGIGDTPRFSVYNIGVEVKVGYFQGDGESEDDGSNDTDDDSDGENNTTFTAPVSATPSSTKSSTQESSEPSRTSATDTPSGTLIGDAATSEPADDGSVSFNFGSIIGTAVAGVAIAVAGPALF